MARTTTKSTAAAKPADATGAAKDQAAPAKAAEATLPDTDTKGAQEAATRAQSPDVPAAQTAPQADSGPSDPLDADISTITVTCLRPEGRRRAGRRWDEGETVIAETALSDFDLAVLEADPMFRIER